MIGRPEMTSINGTTKNRNGMDSMISYGIYEEHTKSSPIKAVTKKQLNMLYQITTVQ